MDDINKFSDDYVLFVRASDVSQSTPDTLYVVGSIPAKTVSIKSRVLINHKNPNDLRRIRGLVIDSPSFNVRELNGVVLVDKAAWEVGLATTFGDCEE